MPPGRPPVQLMRRHRRNFIRCRTARELDFFSSLSSEIGIRNRSIDREGKWFPATYDFGRFGPRRPRRAETSAPKLWTSRICHARSSQLIGR